MVKDSKFYYRLIAKSEQVRESSGLSYSLFSERLRKILLSTFILLIGYNLYCGEFGIGIIIGYPTGISAKYWLEKVATKEAIDFAVSWSVNKTSTIYLHSSWLIHRYDIIKVKDFTGKLPVYYGCGIKVSAAEKTVIGLRIPLGVDYIFKEIPFDIFAELGPVVDLTPSLQLGLTVGMGVRIFFQEYSIESSRS